MRIGYHDRSVGNALVKGGMWLPIMDGYQIVGALPGPKLLALFDNPPPEDVLMEAVMQFANICEALPEAVEPYTQRLRDLGIRKGGITAIYKAYIWGFNGGREPPPEEE